ncbi:MAG: hypothetical protein K2K89_09235 [Ruminococcus sp.]|nr:hypothetical protein [Ruminococcus sp.]
MKGVLIESFLRHNRSSCLPEEKVWIVRNSENTLHPETQTRYAEIYVKLFKENKEKILLSTNSFHFLEAFLFFMEKHGIGEKIRFYVVNNGNITKSSDPYNAFANLSQPSFDIADMKFEYEMERSEENETD